MEKINIFTDFKIKNIHIKNRIVLPPMVRFSLVGDDGYVTEALIQWYGIQISLAEAAKEISAICK